jgi:hypothetical protein
LQESYWPRETMANAGNRESGGDLPGPLVTQGTKVRSHHRHDRTGHRSTHTADLPSTPKAQRLIQQPRHCHAALFRVYRAVLAGSRSTRPVSDLRARRPAPRLVQGPRGHEPLRPRRNCPRGEAAGRLTLSWRKMGDPSSGGGRTSTGERGPPVPIIAPCTCDSTTAKGTWRETPGRGKNGTSSRSSRLRPWSGRAGKRRFCR